MKTFEFQYLNYEGGTPTATIDVEDDHNETDAKLKAISEDQGFGDGIKEILSIYEVSKP